MPPPFDRRFRQPLSFLAHERAPTRIHRHTALMNPSPNIIVRLRSLLKNRNQPECMLVLAGLYWRTLVITALVIALGLVAYGTSQFFSVLGTVETDTAGQSALAHTLFDHAKAQTIVDAFAARGARYQSVLDGSLTRVADPSR